MNKYITLENKIYEARPVLMLQKVNDEKRYEWLEDDGYWEKQLVRDTDF